MLQPKIVSDLRLHDFGYEAVPLDPSYATFGPDGRALFFYNDTARTQAEVARYSKRDAEAYPGYEAVLARAAGFLRPLLLRPPPALGSKRPGDLLGLLREAGRAAGLSRRDVHELFRVMTMSVGDLLDDWFETDALKGAIASTGVVGVWAGPRTPGTAYNLLHHELGELNGVPGAWGHVRGGMGGISQALARSAESHGATVRTGAPVRSIDVRDGRTTGVTLESGEEVRAPLVISGAHPRTTVLDLVGERHFPDEVGEDMHRFRSRGGSVKINCVLSEPPRFARRAPAPHRRGDLPLHRRARARLAGRRARRAGRAPLHRAGGAERGRPVAHGRRHLRRHDVHPVRAALGGRLARRRARGLRGALLRHRVRARPELPGRARAPRGARAARPRAHLRPGRRLDLPGRAGPRPDGVHAPLSAAGPVRHAGGRASTCAAPARTRAAA